MSAEQRNSTEPGAHVLLSGAASGIGLYLAKALLQRGWRLSAMDVQLEAMQRELLPLAGADRLLLLHADVSRSEDWERCLEQCEEHFGPIHVLINNAAVITPARVIASGPRLVDKHIDVNLKSVMYSTSMAATRMKRNGIAGHIINVSSMAGIAPVPGIGAYSASKFGVRAYSLVANQELSEFGIAVTCVCPDLVNTPMLDLQLNYEEASISFSGPGAMEAGRVGEAILKSMHKRPAELIIPAHRGWLAKLSSMFPVLMKPLKKRLEAKGLRQAERYRQGLKSQSPR